MTLRLASGATAFAQARPDFASDWSDDGTQADFSGDRDCSNGAVLPLACHGDAALSGKPDVQAGVKGGAVFVVGDVQFASEDTGSCAASTDATTPYLGFANALDPYSSGSGVTSLAKIAKLRKGASLRLAVHPGPPSSSDYDVATCNGLSGALDTCTGSLKLSGAIVVTRLR